LILPCKIDSLFQLLPTPPALHVIIEPHPDVLAHMKATGWYDRPGVRILEGKWQDYVHSDDLLSIGGFDVVYTDTFSEDYQGKMLLTKTCYGAKQHFFSSP
jgi:type IV protein arginine methyltransferase